MAAARAKVVLALAAAALMGASSGDELVLARVDGTPILRYDLDRRVEGRERPNAMMVTSGSGPSVGMTDGWPHLAPAPRLEARKRMLDALIKDRVVEIAAKRLKIIVTDSEADAKWAEYVRDCRGLCSPTRTTTTRCARLSVTGSSAARCSRSDAGDRRAH